VIILLNNKGEIMVDNFFIDFNKFKTELTEEQHVKVADIVIKCNEQKNKNKFSNSPLVPILITALIGIAGAAFTNIYQSVSLRILERDKFEAQLILKAIESDSEQKRVDNLKFLVEANLITNYKENIDTLTQNPKQNLKNIDFTIKSPIAQTKPPVPIIPVVQKNNINNNSANYWEYKGFESLLNMDIDNSINYFSNAERKYPALNNVYEINSLLKRKEKTIKTGDENTKKEIWKIIFRNILKEYTWGMPEEIKNKMIEKAKSL
jgi:hypothetical protein